MPRTCPNCHAPLPAFRVPECPECNAKVNDRGEQPATTHGTRIEPVVEILENSASARSPTTRESRPSDTPPEEQPFRPTQRPPSAILCVLDDGQDTGELIRLRKNRIVIGRTEGDVVIPNDGLMSGEHLELVRQQTATGWRWWARDLNSTNGTFARVVKANINPNQEFLIGSRRYRVHLPALTQEADDEPKETKAWSTSSSIDPQDFFPALVEIRPNCEEIRLPIKKMDVSLGSDPKQCQLVIADDPFIAAKHARIMRDAKGRWQIHASKSKNGIWLRIREVPIDEIAELQVGEQRLLVRVSR